MEHLTRKQRDEVLTEFETQYREAERLLAWFKHNRTPEQLERALELGQKLAAADFWAFAAQRLNNQYKASHFLIALATTYKIFELAERRKLEAWKNATGLEFKTF